MTLDGTIVEANRLCLDTCGFARDEIIGKKFWECGWWSPSPALVEMIQDACLEAAAGRMFRRETSYFIADGSERFVDLVLSPVRDDAGRVLFVAPTGTDITDRRQADERLQRMAADLYAADRRKTEFLATLAHELRNPLAPLRNGLEVMRLAADNPVAVGKARDMMERQLAHMVRLVNDLLDIARITGGKVELRKERVELRSVVASAVETSLPLLEAGGHKLTLDIPEELALDVDPTRLAQVLSNLLNNAAKYTPAGGSIELSARRDGDEVVVAVSDTGVGIPEESLSTIFEMFSQIGQNMDRAQGGLGIGLSLVRRLVELHGGTITAASPGAGEGSTFVVRLPLPSKLAGRGFTP
jgi:PAS domain S-box-containing protein